jgi:hypothetical protein
MWKMPFIGSDLLYKAGLTVNINVYTIMMYCLNVQHVFYLVLNIVLGIE